VVFVHGLNSSHATWAAYGAGTAGYGGTLVAIDKFHATTTGNYSNKNVPQGNSQAGCPEEKDVTGLYDVRYYYGCKLQGDYFTMSFSNKNDLSFTAQAMELRAIVDAVTKLTGKPKVFLVGHSMGGLASRAYIQYLGGGSKVAGLITIGTPHQGSASLFSITPVPALITLTQSLSADVKAMLKPNSEDLNMLNDFTRNPWDTNVKTYAIALNGDTVTNSGDGVVAESSQRNSIFDNTLFKWDGITFRPNYTLPAFTFTFHEVETSDENIRAEVGRKLSQWSQIVP
jgi:pimeloyl-ACP methyl ester carboxylesterase